MKCNHCQAEINEEYKFCPACGKEVNAPETAEETTAVAEETGTVQQCTEVAVEPATEENVKKPEMKPGMSSGKLALIIGAGVVLLAILIALVVSGVDSEKKADATAGGDAVATTGELATEPEDTTPATIPADGDPDDITCKGSYTVSDEQIVAAADQVVATMGEKTLTVADLQVFYWMEVSNFLNEYGDYAIYFGMDYTQPLDTQICEDGRENPVTWQQYFLELAIDNWKCYQALSLDAEEAQFQMDETFTSYLDALPEQLEASAASLELSSALELVQMNMGNGATVEDYLRYMELYYKGYTYYNSLYEQIQPTDAEIEAYFAENEETYAQSDVTKDSGKYVDVRHVLLMPDDENATTDEDGYPVYSDEAWEACRQEAEALYEQWQSGDMSEDSFAELAKNNSEDGNAATGGLYTDVTDGYMVETFNDWCFDEARTSGDHGLVKTQFGYHIMYFVDSRDIWFSTAKSDLIGELASDLITASMEKHPATVDFSAIQLGFVDLTVE